MSDDLANWLADCRDNRWVMPSAPKWKRLPVIRHLRASLLTFDVLRHEMFCSRMGLIPNGYDRWVLWGIAHGYEAPMDKEKPE